MPNERMRGRSASERDVLALEARVGLVDRDVDGELGIQVVELRLTMLFRLPQNMRRRNVDAPSGQPMPFPRSARSPLGEQPWCRKS
jgi:hypothetical protein